MAAQKQQQMRGMGAPMAQGNKWKMQSEQFRAAMRAARGAPVGGGGGGRGGMMGGYD